LREAIGAANANPGSTIVFAIPAADSGCVAGVCTIQPNTPLPSLTAGGTTIDGSTQGATNPFGPSIVVNGSLCNCNGIVLASDNNHLDDLVVNAFTGGGSGIEIRGSNNSVTGSYVGLDATGAVAVENRFQGISVLSGTGNVIGGSSPAERNVVSGNNGQGIWLASSGNTVRGNFIGTDRTGTLALGNGLEGVFIWPCPFGNCPGGPAQNNVVGGSAPGEGNVISGNSDGVWIQDSANLVEGNFIGTDVSGTLPLGDRNDGVHIASGTANEIGGTAAEQRNIISGNGSDGINVGGGSSGESTGNLIQGNFIGTDQTGTTALPNRNNGVEIDSGASDNVVGASTPQARNIISGNGGNGVQIHDPATQFNVVEGNFIGTDATGTIALGNTFGGVNLANGASANTIGGTQAGSGNLVSGNPHNGVNIDGGSGNLVQGNLIGTDASGTASLPNAFHGVSIGISASASDNRVERNVIAHNGLDGVIVAQGVNNAISRNSVFSNGGLGIDLGGDGVTLNDPGDADTGPNNLQNFPVLTSALVSPGRLVVRGTIDTPSPQTVVLEFFANPVPVPGGDPSGYGEGAVFLGTATPAPDGSFTAVLPSVASGTLISATATDAAGNTSEFAQDVAALTLLPTSKDQCKDGGWQSFGVFKNQGDCVSYVATDGKNPPNG
jgi:titin